MKKIFTILAVLAISLTTRAQLAWDTEFTKNDLNDPQIVISKTDNVSWALTGGLQVGTVKVLSDFSDECVIALPQSGIADSLFFAWIGATGGSVSVYQSKDHNNWSSVFTAEGDASVTSKSVGCPLATTTRYIKFAATGRLVPAVFTKIKVTELKRLSASTDEWPFGSAMVDAAPATKNVTITWTNIVANITSTDPHFSASVSTVGQKNLVDQTTQIAIRYDHAEAGSHSGYIVIAGEGREVRIAVSGETKKYDQTLTWIQELGECIATDRVTLNAFTSSALDIVYESSDPGIAYVENSVVQIVKAGTVTLTATQPGNYKFNAAQPIAKTLTIHKANPVIGVTVEDITYGQPLSEAVIRETMNLVEGSFSWMDIDPATVLDAGDYALKVLFTPANEGIYNTREVPVALHINKAVQTIVWEDQPTDLKVGEPVASTAVLSSGLPITYAFTECLLSIENGIITPENEGEVTVVAYHPGNNNYLPTTVIMTVFTISAAALDDPTDAPLTPQQLRAAQKYIHNGKVFVSHGGHTYDADGKFVR